MLLGAKVQKIRHSIKSSGFFRFKVIFLALQILGGYTLVTLDILNNLFVVVACAVIVENSIGPSRANLVEPMSGEDGRVFYEVTKKYRRLIKEEGVAISRNSFFLRRFRMGLNQRPPD